MVNIFGGDGTRKVQGLPGPRGVPGRRGPQGHAGPSGVAGPKGDKGDTGSAGVSICAWIPDFFLAEFRKTE